MLWKLDVCLLFVNLSSSEVTLSREGEDGHYLQVREKSSFSGTEKGGPVPLVAGQGGGAAFPAGPTIASLMNPCPFQFPLTLSQGWAGDGILHSSQFCPTQKNLTIIFKFCWLSMLALSAFLLALSAFIGNRMVRGGGRNKDMEKEVPLYCLAGCWPRSQMLCAGEWGPSFPGTLT